MRATSPCTRVGRSIYPCVHACANAVQPIHPSIHPPTHLNPENRPSAWSKPTSRRRSGRGRRCKRKGRPRTPPSRRCSPRLVRVCERDWRFPFLHRQSHPTISMQVQALTLELDFLHSHPAPAPPTAPEAEKGEEEDAAAAAALAEELRGRVEGLEAERESLLSDRRLLKAHAKELVQQVGGYVGSTVCVCACQIRAVGCHDNHETPPDDSWTTRERSCRRRRRVWPRPQRRQRRRKGRAASASRSCRRGSVRVLNE